MHFFSLDRLLFNPLKMSDSMDNDAIEPEDVINTDHFNHPYFPRDLNLPGYVPMVVDFVYILGVFFAAVLAVFTATWFVSGQFRNAASVHTVTISSPQKPLTP
jgi:hypothetical protein